MTSARGRDGVPTAEAQFLPGQELTFTTPSPCTLFSVVFEDDGQTGYFYALDTAKKEKDQTLDALHVYNVADLADRHKASRIQVMWSVDGLRVVLLVNGHAHAAFDFVKGRGYSRTNLPPPSAGGFSSESHAWSDEVLAFFT